MTQKQKLYWCMRLPFDEFRRVLWDEYAIDAFDDGSFNGFIKKSRYRLRIPLLKEGQIVNFLDEYTEVKMFGYLSTLRRYLMDDMRRRPEYYAALKDAVTKMKEDYRRKKAGE